MDPLSVAASITALLQLTSTVVQYVNGVKGAAADRGRILSELASVNSILLLLQDEADRDDQDGQWSSTFQSLKKPEGPLVQFRGALERLSSELAPPATGLKKVGKAITWPFQKEEVKEILGSIERQKALLNLARQNDHIKLSKAIKDDVISIRNEVDAVAKGVSRIQMHQISSEHQKIIGWLDGPDPSTNYNKALKDRNPKTGSWFIESNIFAEWKNTRGSFLWLHGIPGCGKTILCTSILQNVLDHHHTKPDSAVIFFYFDFNDVKKQRYEKMIRSLICQLSKHCANSILQDLYTSYLNGSRQPTEEELLITLRRMMATLGDTYIVLDALDECVDRSELFTILDQIMSWEDEILHVLVTSRKEHDIEEALTPLTNKEHRVRIQSKLVNADIRIYTHDRLQIDRKLKRWQKNSKVQSEIEDTLVKKAGGMFRWVACQLDLLGDCFNLPQLRQALTSLPKTLDDTYARILCNIDKDYNHCRREVLKILQWLAFSARPLQLKELAEIVAIDVYETPRFVPERRWPEPRDIMTICSSLITLTNLYDTFEKESSEDSQDLNADNVSLSSYSEVSETYVRLAHFSVKEYLVSDRIQHSMALHYSIHEIASHAVLAEDCIAYILHFGEEEQELHCGIIDRGFPLVNYALHFWVSHAKHAERGSIKSTSDMGMELLLSKGEGLLSWAHLVDHGHPRMSGRKMLEQPASPLYYASSVGLSELVRMLIEKRIDVNAQGGYYGNALQAASCLGQKDIVQILLNNGADANIQGGRYGNALQVLIHSTNNMIMQSLRNYGINMNTYDGSWGNALQAASCSGQKDIVQILLDHGADVNAQGGYIGSALQAASCSGQKDIVQILLDHGADVNAQGGYFGSALQAALFSGQADTVQVLLDKGADPNAMGANGSALQLASKLCNEDMVKMLLEKGADVNARGAVLSALQLASERGNANIVKMLLDKGADVNARGAVLSALQLASERGNANIVKILVDRGADINARSARHSALWLASNVGHEDIVEILLDRGADVNADPGFKAVHMAMIYGHMNIVKMLRAKGAR